MTSPRFSVAASLLAVFLGGVVVGGFGQRLYMAKTVAATVSGPRNADEWRKEYVETLRSRLKLNNQQVARLNVILDETRDQFKAFRERHKEETKAIHDAQVANIEQILDAGQRTEYERFREERDRLRQAGKN
jgi:hypothetical protein